MKYLFLLALTLFSLNLFAHSGRTDSSGCHHDRKNGGYHCHRSEDTLRKVSSNVAEDYDVTFNQKSKIYHRPGCSSAKACTVNCTSLKKSEAIERGARACGNCGG